MSGPSLGLAVAGVTFEIELPHPNWLPALAQRYEGFLHAGDAAWRVRVLHEPQAGPDEQWLRQLGDRAEFRVGAYRGEVDLAAKRAFITAPAEERAGSAVDRITGFVCMHELPRARAGLLLHGVAVERAGAGLAFCGPSGSGKTTVAGLARGFAETLVDEHLVVQPGAGGFDLVSTPFWGASTPPERIHRVNRRVPLRAIYLLHHAPEFSLRRLSPGAAVMGLLATEKLPVEPPESSTAWLATAGELVTRVSVYDLGFLPTPALWDFLSGSV